MVKYSDKGGVCEFIVDPPFLEEDIDNIKLVLGRSFCSWNIRFGRIYNVPKTLIDLLYTEIFINQKDISLFAHKYKLNKYFNKLGFSSVFNSLIKDKIAQVESIEVILIGGSTDSSSKIRNIIKNVSFNNLSLVIVQHVGAKFGGVSDTVLQKHTTKRVSYISHMQKLQAGYIYIAPPDKHLKIEYGYFTLSYDKKVNNTRPSISVSYESFSAYYKEKLLVIQECGYFNDGVDKVEFIKQNNSLFVLQDKDECEAKSMVNNTIIAKADYVLKQKDMVDYLNLIDKEYSSNHYVEYLLEQILIKYAYDFRLYNRAMLKRRLSIFMIKHSIQSVKNAVAIILFNKSAFKVFFLDISISVTEFFRKPKSFEYSVEFLQKYYQKSRNIKVWSAGCSSGEEVYSMAIIMESLGLLDRTILYATDYNSVVIEEAKNALYSLERFEQGKENYVQIGLKDEIENYFYKNDNYVTINEKIQKKVLFFKHNLVLDSSFNEFDIIICKNVIIYFDYDLQEKVFQLFCDSLKSGGYLVLGESELIHTKFQNKFEQYHEKCKIYKKVS